VEQPASNKPIRHADALENGTGLLRAFPFSLYQTAVMAKKTKTTGNA